ncbi:MAG: hypothetical protein PHE08_06535 [Bacteroidales bacterium]|nr:hypothetical protein [Bacteroidales bacterium]
MIYFKNLNNPIAKIDDIYSEYSKKEFKSPFRSTIPLIVLFKSDQTLNLEMIYTKSNIDIKDIFEYQLHNNQGRAPSCTDLMIEYTNGCIAIEAKRTERPYETVRKWLSESPNRTEVLNAWLAIINLKIQSKVQIKDISDLPYQLIHRVASGCSLNKQHTIIAYIGFDLNEAKTKYYIDCLTRFSKILKNKLDFFLYCYEIVKSDEQKKLEGLWKDGKRDLSQEVIQEIKDNKLMEVTLKKKYQINKYE